MKSIITLSILIALMAQPAGGTSRDDTYLPDEYGYDDGTFESFGTATDWADMAIGLFQVGGDCSVFVYTLRIYGYGDTVREVFIDTAADLDTPPAALRGTGVHFNPGTTSSDDAGWIDIDLSSLDMYFFPNEVFAIGVDLTGNSGIGLDDSCEIGTCGYYWTRSDGLWRQESTTGRNVGMRLIAPGTCYPTETGNISAIKSLYK